MHFTPDDVDRLTVRDFDLLATQLETEWKAGQQAAKDAAGSARRRR